MTILEKRASSMRRWREKNRKAWNDYLRQYMRKRRAAERAAQGKRMTRLDRQVARENQP